MTVLRMYQRIGCSVHCVDGVVFYRIMLLGQYCLVYNGIHEMVTVCSTWYSFFVCNDAMFCATT